MNYAYPCYTLIDCLTQMNSIAAISKTRKHLPRKYDEILALV